MRLLRIDSRPGFTPTIGRLVAMLTFARESTIEAVAGLSVADLDHRHDAGSNSIGALLAHVAAVEWWYQRLTFDQREPTAAEEAPWLAALDLGERAGREIRGRELGFYVAGLDEVRRATLAALAARDDDWLERSLAARPEMNAHWAWFHVAEDEISHRGQIRWLRTRLPGV